MKFPCRALLVLAGAVSTVSAAECSEKQLADYANFNLAPVEKACPSLFLEGEGTADPSDVETFTAASLKALEPCKDQACLAALKKFDDATPDCSVNGFSIKSANTVTIKLCEAFGAGPVSVETAKSLFKDVESSLTTAFGSLMDDSDARGSQEADASVPEGKSSNATGNDATSATTTPGAASVPKPAPTTKSDASAERVATGIATFATAALVVSFFI